MVRLFDDRQLCISGTGECLIGVRLHPVVVVLHAVRVADVAQQVAVHPRIVYGVVDVGLVIRPSFGEVPVTRAEHVPFAHVDGRLYVHFVLFLFPV